LTGGHPAFYWLPFHLEVTCSAQSIVLFEKCAI
jgi:hypothetical protein